jgi:hypothetical protein
MTLSKFSFGCGLTLTPYIVRKAYSGTYPTAFCLIG